MIQSFSGRYSKHIAWPLFLLFYLQLLSPLYAAGHIFGLPITTDCYGGIVYNSSYKQTHDTHIPGTGKLPGEINNAHNISPNKIKKTASEISILKTTIGGPSTPEASSFKAAGSDNLVNLFTGDFSYSIPLMDVGGYPVNIFYSGGITMDQEASWVGLGWNTFSGSPCLPSCMFQTPLCWIFSPS